MIEIIVKSHEEMEKSFCIYCGTQYTNKHRYEFNNWQYRAPSWFIDCAHCGSTSGYFVIPDGMKPSEYFGNP